MRTLTRRARIGAALALALAVAGAVIVLLRDPDAASGASGADPATSPSPIDSELAAASRESRTIETSPLRGATDSRIPDLVIRVVQAIAGIEHAVPDIPVVVRAGPSYDAREIWREATLEPGSVEPVEGALEPAATCPGTVLEAARAEGYASLWIGFGYLGAPPPEHEIALRTFAGERVSLRLGETGTIVVAARCASGWSPPGGTIRVAITDPRTGEPTAESVSCAREESREARFLVAATGFLFEARAEVAGFPAARALGIGPHRENDESIVDLVFGQERVAIRFRLVDVNGVVMAQRDVDVGFEGPTADDPDAGWCTTATSDEAGMITLSLSGADAAVIEHLLVSMDGPESCFASVALPEVRSPGLMDLGDVVPGSAPVLAGGRVVDSRGEPIADAEVVLFGGSVTVSAPTDGAGRFRIRGRLEQETVRIDAWDKGSGRARDDFIVECGRDDLVLTLRRPGSLAGRILFDESVPCANVLMGVERIDGRQRSEAGSFAAEGTLPFDGILRWSSAAAGTYELRFRLVGERYPFLVIPDITIEEGLRNEDPRLNPIDLRGRIRMIRMTVLTPEGSQPPIGTLVVNAKEQGEELREGFMIRGAPVFIATSKAECDVEIRVPGCSNEMLAAVRDDVTVRLRAGRVLTLRVPEGVPTPPEGFRISIVVRSATAAPTRERVERFLHGERLASFDQARSFEYFQRVGIEGGTIRLGNPGRYEIQTLLGQGDWSVLFGETRMLEVPPGSDPLSSTVSWSEADLAVALEHVRQ